MARGELIPLLEIIKVYIDLRLVIFSRNYSPELSNTSIYSPANNNQNQQLYILQLTCPPPSSASLKM